MLRVVIALLLLAAGPVSATEYELDAAHSYVGFSVRHMMVTNQRGQFQKLSGALRWDERNPDHGAVEATVEVASVDTHDAKRDEHLRGPDFFDVAHFPQMVFRSKRFERAGDRWLIVGELSLHGVTRALTLEAGPLSHESKDPFGNVKVGTSARATLSRKDFGLTWNKALETGGIAVGDEVQITLDLEFNKKK